MNIVPPIPPPPELTNLAPWEQYLASTIAPPNEEFLQAYAELLAGEPRRLILYAPGQLIAASEYNLDLFRSLTSTISGLEPGNLEDTHAEIHYHPMLHRADHTRLTHAVEAQPDDSYLVVAIDWAVNGNGWICAGINSQASIPWPSLSLLRYLHADWNLSDVSPRIEVLQRWAARAVPNQKLKAIK